MIVGNRKFVELPGETTHELPPLLVGTSPGLKRLDRVMDMAGKLVDSDVLVPGIAGEDRKMDLAIQVVEQYMTLVDHWTWGDSIMEWIRQCETTFEVNSQLRPLLRPDVWPHAGRSSFIDLLHDKHVDSGGVEMEKAVGLRLTFRQPPPLACFSDQFLFYLNQSMTSTAYQTWAKMAPAPVSSLPPERFTFQVVNLH